MPSLQVSFRLASAGFSHPSWPVQTLEMRASVQPQLNCLFFNYKYYKLTVFTSRFNPEFPRLGEINNQDSRGCFCKRSIFLFNAFPLFYLAIPWSDRTSDLPLLADYWRIKCHRSGISSRRSISQIIISAHAKTLLISPLDIHRWSSWQTLASILKNIVMIFVQQYPILLDLQLTVMSFCGYLAKSRIVLSSPCILRIILIFFKINPTIHPCLVHCSFAYTSDRRISEVCSFQSLALALKLRNILNKFILQSLTPRRNRRPHNTGTCPLWSLPE